MPRGHMFTFAGAFLLAAILASPAAALSPKERLGKKLFFDTSLSANGTQSCAECHNPQAGFTGPDPAVNAEGAVYRGALPHRFGNRKPPTAAYAGDSPVLHQNGSGAWFGGMFFDGRATGAVLGDPLAEQAQGPYLNPLEQALANSQVLCVKVKQADYAELFKQVWGAGSLDCAKDAKGVYERIGRSVAAYERSQEVNPFSSQFDLFWDNATAAGKDVTKIKCGSGGMGGGGMGGGGMGGGGMGGGGMGGGGMGGGGMGGGGMGGGGMGGGGMGCPGGGMNGWASYRNLGLSDAELQGLAVFNDPNQAACSGCHSLKPGKAGYPLFTDFGYYNIGTPKNPANPFYSMPPSRNPDGPNWVDYGLGGYLQSAGYAPAVSGLEMGKHKNPTLRNVDLRPYPGFVKAYGHNGVFKSLDDIVFFYHWRAAMDGGMCGGGGMGGGGMGGGGMGGGGMGGGGMGGGGMGGGGMGNCDAMAAMFPPPEVDQNRAGMNMFPRAQVDNIVLFLKTLSDGYYQK